MSMSSLFCAKTKKDWTGHVASYERRRMRYGANDWENISNQTTYESMDDIATL